MVMMRMTMMMTILPTVMMSRNLTTIATCDHDKKNGSSTESRNNAQKS